MAFSSPSILPEKKDSIGGSRTSTRTTFGSMVSTTRTGTGLTVAGTNVFELLGDFCSATTRTNFNYRFVNRSATILSVR